MLESKFQTNLIKEIKERFPGAVVLKNDEQYLQGVPNLTVLYKDKWAVLECKRDAKSTCRPNQEYYVNLFNGMSYSNFIHPQNKEEVLDELQRSFEVGR